MFTTRAELFVYKSKMRACAFSSKNANDNSVFDKTETTIYLERVWRDVGTIMIDYRNTGVSGRSVLGSAGGLIHCTVWVRFPQISKFYAATLYFAR